MPCPEVQIASWYKHYCTINEILDALQTWIWSNFVLVMQNRISTGFRIIPYGSGQNVEMEFFFYQSVQYVSDSKNATYRQDFVQSQAIMQLCMWKICYFFLVKIAIPCRRGIPQIFCGKRNWYIDLPYDNIIIPH